MKFNERQNMANLIPNLRASHENSDQILKSVRGGGLRLRFSYLIWRTWGALTYRGESQDACWSSAYMLRYTLEIFRTERKPAKGESGDTTGDLRQEIYQSHPTYCTTVPETTQCGTDSDIRLANPRPRCESTTNTLMCRGYHPTKNKKWREGV